MSDINNEIILGAWCWCLHCQRCYKKGEFRKIKMRKNSIDYQFAISSGHEPVRELCPYVGCDGDVWIDCYAWFGGDKSLPNLPKVPERNKVYSFYG